jgi:hypothetical protein
MFQALFADHQEALHTQQLAYFVRIMSAGCLPWQHFLFSVYYELTACTCCFPMPPHVHYGLRGPPPSCG